MSTDYYIITGEKSPPKYQKVIKQLKKYGIKEHYSTHNDLVGQKPIIDERCITDGQNYLWTYLNKDGTIQDFTRYGSNDVEGMIEIISGVIGLEIIDEHEYMDRYLDNEDDGPPK